MLRAAILLLLLPAGLLLAQTDEVAITTSSTEARDLFVNGRDKFENTEFATAAPLFDQAIQKDPNFALAYLFRAQSGGGGDVFRRNLDKAVSLADKVSPGERLVILATKANTDGDRAKYKEYLDEILLKFPKDKRSHAAMGGYYSGSGDTEGAIPHYQKAVEVDKNFAPVHNILGYAYKGLGKYKEAEDAFKKYMELAPKSPNPTDSYAELLLKMGRFDESIQYYQKAADMDPAFTGAIGGIGFNYIHKGDFAKARQYFGMQYAKGPQPNLKLAALANTMLSYLHEWNIEAALKAAEQYGSFAEQQNLLGGRFTHQFFLGWIHLETGNAEEAKKYFGQARTRNESLPLSASAKGFNDVNLQASMCYVMLRSKDFSGAKKGLEDLKKTVDKRKNRFELEGFHTAMGNLETEQGNYDQAIEHLMKGDPENPYNRFSLAVAYERKGDQANAKKWYKETANWNWTGLPYALVRARAMKKM